MPGPHPPDAMPPLPPPSKFNIATSRTEAAKRRALDRMGRAMNSQWGDVVNPPLSGDNRAACNVATTVAGTLATDFETGDTVDGVTLVQFMRLLVKNQASAIENGIYVVQMSGQPQRAQDLPPNSHAAGAFCFVLQGTQAGQVWRCTSASGSDVVDTNNLTWGQFTPSGGGGGTPTFHGTRLESPSSSFAVGSHTLAWGVVDFDTDSWFDGTSNIVVGITGYYLCILNLGVNITGMFGAVDFIVGEIQTSVGVGSRERISWDANIGVAEVAFSTLVPLSAGDSVFGGIQISGTVNSYISQNRLEVALLGV